jgi:hypothetical protein
MTYATSSLTSQTTGTAIPLNKNNTNDSPATVILDFTTGTGVGTASAEFTIDDPSVSGAIWLALTNLTGKTATAYDTVNTAMRAVRLNVTAYTSGTITLRVLQGSS